MGSTSPPPFTQCVKIHPIWQRMASLTTIGLLVYRTISPIESNIEIKFWVIWSISVEIKYCLMLANFGVGLSENLKELHAPAW